MPTTTIETPPDLTEAPPVDFSDAGALFGHTPAEEPAAVVSKEPAKIEPEQVEPSVSLPSAETPAPAPGVVSKSTKGTEIKSSRDFKDFEADDIEPLKKAPNHVYDHFKSRLPELYKSKRELEELKKQEAKSAQERYLLADDAYKQAPEFQSYSNAVENLETEVHHWREQLENLDKNGKAYDLGIGKGSTGDLSKPITYVRLREEVSRAKVLENFTKAQARLESVSVQRESIAGSYKQQQQAYVQEAKQAATKYFGWADKLEGKQKEELDVLRKQLGPLSMGFAGETTTRAIYTCKLLVDTNNKLQAEIAQLKQQAEKAGRANPLQFGGVSNRETTPASGNIYDGITPDVFQR